MISIGPLTNLATAMILEPGVGDLVRDFVCMGGTMFGFGNVP